MMKKISLKLLAALVILTAFVQSCRQENLYTENEDNSLKAKPIISVLNYEDVEHDKALSKEISNLKNKFSRNNGFSARTVQDSLLDGAVIETNKVLLIEDGDKKTYTIPVSRTFPNNKIENLILKKNADNSFSGLLAQYTVTEQQRQHFQNGNPINLDSNAKFYKIDNLNIGARVQTDVVGCYEITWETGYCSSGQHSTGNDTGCTVGGAPQPAILSVQDICTTDSNLVGGSSGSSGSSGGGYVPISGGGGGGGVSLQPISPYNTYIFMSYDDAFLQCSQDDEQCAQNWANHVNTVIFFNSLNRNSVLSGYNSIFFAAQEYLVANQFSPESYAFLTERLNIIGNWYRVQDNSNDEKKLDNFKFADWALKYFMNSSNQEFVNYYKNNQIKFNALKFSNFNPYNPFEAQGANAMANMITEYFIAEQNGTVSQLQSNWVGWNLVKESMELFIKGNIVAAVKLGRWIYEFADAYFPAMNIPLINLKLAEMKTAILLTDTINMNPNTMKWKDVVACWLLEVGDFPVNNSAGYSPIPTIGFAGADYVISGIPNQLNQMRYLTTHKTLANGNPSPNSVVDLRKRVIERIQQGNLASLDGNWGFEFDAMIDTIKELDGLQFCLGSYITNVHITPLGNNQYKLTFIVKNKTGWESGTRGLNNNDGNSTNDSIIPDKPRGQGIHLGGTIGETYGWYEIVTVLP